MNTGEVWKTGTDEPERFVVASSTVLTGITGAFIHIRYCKQSIGILYFRRTTTKKIQQFVSESLGHQMSAFLLSL